MSPYGDSRPEARATVRARLLVGTFALMACILGSTASMPALAAASAAELNSVRGQIRQGALPQALASLDGLLKQHPGDPQLRFMQGVALAESGQVDEAIRVFTNLTGDYPDLPEPHNNLAVLYASKGDYENARDALLVAINTHPSYATAHENLGDIYAKMARIAYDRALSLNTGNRTAQAKLNLLRDLFSVREAGGNEPVTNVAVAPKPAAPSAVAKAPATPQPASPKPAPSAPEVDVSQAVAHVQSWAAAWSSQNVDSYLSHYHSGFRPASGLSRQRWASQRAVRLKRPKYIEVSVGRFDVHRLASQQIAVSFDQGYRSDTYKDTVRKRLILTNEGGKFRIVSEATVQ